MQQPIIKGTNRRQKTCEIFHVYCTFYSGFMCQTNVIFGITKDGSLVLNPLASRSCFTCRNGTNDMPARLSGLGWWRPKYECNLNLEKKRKKQKQKQKQNKTKKIKEKKVGPLNNYCGYWQKMVRPKILWNFCCKKKKKKKKKHSKFCIVWIIRFLIKLISLW